MQLPFSKLTGIFSISYHLPRYCRDNKQSNLCGLWGPANSSLLLSLRAEPFPGETRQNGLHCSQQQLSKILIQMRISESDVWALVECHILFLNCSLFRYALSESQNLCEILNSIKGEGTGLDDVRCYLKHFMILQVISELCANQIYSVCRTGTPELVEFSSHAPTQGLGHKGFGR